MSNEFDIRIGTLLDTSKAEQQLQEFISKYKDEDGLTIDLKINGEEKLTGLEKSLNNIKNLAKSVGDIKIDVDGDFSKIGTNLGDSLNKGLENVENSTKRIGEGLETGFEDATKQVEKNVTDIQKKIKTMIDNLENLKLNPFSDADGIDNLLNTLKKVQNVDLNNFSTEGLKDFESGLNEISKTYNELASNAKNKQLDNIFQATKVEPLMNQLKALKEVMDFKNLDTSGIDNLITQLQKTSEYSNDLKKAKAIFADVKDSFGNMKTALGMTDIKSAETAIKKLLTYKEELNKQIALEIDTSKVKQAQDEIKKIDETIDRLREISDASLVQNIIDVSDLKNIENMEKVANKLSDTFDKLKAKADQIGKMEFVDMSSMNAIESYIKDVEQAIKSLDFSKADTKFDISNIEEAKNKLNILEKSLDSVKDSAENLKLNIKFDADLEKASQELNGLHSALIKIGANTNEIKRLEEQLESIKGLAKVDLDQATNELKEFSKAMNNMGKEMNLGNIKGDMSQFTKYVNDIVSAMKKLATTKDVNFAKALQDQINQAQSAIKQLSSTFDKAQKEFAQGFANDAFKGLGDKFNQEVDKIETEVNKLKTVLTRLDMDMNFDNVTGDLAEKIERAVMQVKILDSALKNLDGTNMNVEEVKELQQELEQAKQSVIELSQHKIDLDCQEAISQVEKLKRELESVGESTEGLDDVIRNINNVNDSFKNGTTSYDKATSQIKRYTDALKESSDINIKSFDAFDSIGKGLERTFGSIKDAFSTFTVGELLEEGIENAIYGIKETILGLDEAMTHLKMVSDDIDFNGDGYQQMANQAREVALNVGQSVEDIIEGMSTAYQEIKSLSC